MKKYQRFLSENFSFLEVKFSIYLNRRVFVMSFPSNFVNKLTHFAIVHQIAIPYIVTCIIIIMLTCLLYIRLTLILLQACQEMNVFPIKRRYHNKQNGAMKGVKPSHGMLMWML